MARRDTKTFDLAVIGTARQRVRWMSAAEGWGLRDSDRAYGEPALRGCNRKVLVDAAGVVILSAGPLDAIGEPRMTGVS